MKCRATTAGLIAIILIALPVYAFSYSAPMVIIENGSTSYNMTAFGFAANNQYMADNGFMLGSALDTRVQTLGGVESPHMVTDNQTLFAIEVPANSQTNLYYVTGESSLSAMGIIPGGNGYITIADSANQEISDNFTIELDLYLGNLQNNILVKSGAMSLERGTDNVTFSINGGESVSSSGLSPNGEFTVRIDGLIR